MLRARSGHTTGPHLSGLIHCSSHTRPESRPFQLTVCGRPCPSDLTCATAGAGGYHPPRPGGSPEARPAAAGPRLHRSLGHLVGAVEPAPAYLAALVCSCPSQNIPRGHCRLPPHSAPPITLLSATSTVGCPRQPFLLGEAAAGVTKLSSARTGQSSGPVTTTSHKG